MMKAHVFGRKRNRGRRACGGLLTLVVPLFVAMLIMPAGAGVAHRTAARAITHGGAITVVGSFNFPTLDPTSPKASVGSGQVFFSSIFDSLFVLNAHGQSVPELVQSDSIAKNGKTITLVLHRGIKFSDNTPLNATAVAWNLNRDRDPANACTCLPFLSNITSMTTPNAYEVVLHLSAPYAPLISALTNSAAAFMVSPTAYSSEGATEFGLKPVGAGPFTVAGNTPQVTLVLQRNPHYWQRGLPYLNTITFNSITQLSSAFATLQSGAAQLMLTADPTSLTQARGSSSLRIIALPATNFFTFQFNVNVPPFNSYLAREAVAEAIDFPPINRAVYGGLETPSESIFGKGDQFYVGPKVSGYRAYNPTAAAALVKQLGGLSFTTYTIQNTSINEELLQALQKQFSAVGINDTIQNIQEAQVLTGYLSGNFTDIVVNYGGYSDDGIYASDFFLAGGTFQHGLNDPTLNAMVNDANSTFNTAKRAQLFKQMSQYVNQKLYFVPLYTAPAYDIASNTLQGIPRSPLVYMTTAYLKK